MKSRTSGYLFSCHPEQLYKCKTKGDERNLFVTSIKRKSLQQNMPGLGNNKVTCLISVYQSAFYFTTSTCMYHRIDSLKNIVKKAWVKG